MVLYLTNAVGAKVKNGSGEHRVGFTFDNAINKVVQRSNATAGNDRNRNGVSNGA